MKEYLEITEIKDLDSNDPNPAEHILVYVTDKNESVSKLKTIKKDMTMTKYKAKHVKSKHEEGEPCEEEILEEVN